jgi:LmbE family N-acetylglucosaminyl deacetylase
MALIKKAPFIGKRIVVFTAHPDDEGLAAGTMYANHNAGGEAFLLCATYGERGKSHLTRPVSGKTLKRIRKNELLRAAKVLKIDKVIFFGFPDARVRENAKKLFEKSSPIIKEIAPEYILSFGPEGISAHWDHITVGRVAKRIARKLNIPLFAFTLASEVVARPRRKHFLRRRKFGRYAGVPKHRAPDLKVRVNAVVKRRALRNHRSQFGDRPPFAELPRRVREKLFSYEHFVREKV